MDLNEYIRDVQDFPKPGVLFKDITPILLSPEATEEALKQLCQQAEGLGVNKVAAVESRGFFFGSLIANKMGVGYVPVRKKGKLPYKTISMEYALEYGTDTIEIHTDAIQKGDKVLIHDDILATGGTAEAVVKLVEKAGGEVVLVSFLMKLNFLHGEDKLKGKNIKSLLEY